MSIDELIAKTQRAAKNRTREQTLELFRNANILDKNGNFKKGYFSQETIDNAKKSKA